MAKNLSHINKSGQTQMVDVSPKPMSNRTASAQATVSCSTELQKAVEQNALQKGNLIETAKLAGIMAAKRTSDLIPLCHPLILDNIQIEIEYQSGKFSIISKVSTSAKTGVEMEALTAASVSALTIYDMGKAIDHAITINSIRLLTKSGGQSGDINNQ